MVPEEVPTFINDFFTNIGPNLAKQHKDQWVYYGDVNEHVLPDFETDFDEVHKLCKEINTMKSSGMDEISARVCKDAFLILADKLVHIFNCSLSSAVFPDAWKAAKVVPLFKGGAREFVGNYRPISLLPLPGKLLEKIVHNKISSFLEEHNVLSEHQGGFRKGFSTTSTISDLTDDLFTGVNQGLTTLAAFIDLKKAFDTVNLPILLQKLECSGIRNTPFRWCENYLSGRNQRTVANGFTSGIRPVTCGVPQGSVLGPLFFLIYVNDLQSALDDCKIKLYADDTVLYQAGFDSNHAEFKLQASMNLFSQWCSANALTVNAKKTKIMAFGSRSKVKKCQNVKIKLRGISIRQVPSFKYLGLTLDPTLNFGQHMSTIIKNVQHKIHLLGKVKRYLHDDVAVKIYKTMVLPYLDYADVIFCKTNSSQLDKLQRLQNRCLRLCLGKDRMFDTNRAHKEANVPFLADRRNAHTLNFMYQRSGKRPDLLNRREIRTRAHDAPLFDTAIPRCEAFKRSVGYHGTVAWNNLPPDIRNISPYPHFKALQKREMLTPLALIV